MQRDNTDQIDPNEITVPEEIRQELSLRWRAKDKIRAAFFSGSNGILRHEEVSGWNRGRDLYARLYLIKKVDGNWLAGQIARLYRSGRFNQQRDGRFTLHDITIGNLANHVAPGEEYGLVMAWPTVRSAIAKFRRPGPPAPPPFDDEPLPTDLSLYDRGRRKALKELPTYTETAQVLGVEVEAQRFSWRHSRTGLWPVYQPGERPTEGNICIAFRYREKLYLRAIEWVGPGQTSKEFDPGAGGSNVGVRMALHIKPHIAWRPQEGEPVGVLFLNEEANERSNLVQFPWSTHAYVRYDPSPGAGPGPPDNPEPEPTPPPAPIPEPTPTPEPEPSPPPERPEEGPEPEERPEERPEEQGESYWLREGLSLLFEILGRWL